jgi:hypothetical protein
MGGRLSSMNATSFAHMTSRFKAAVFVPLLTFLFSFANAADVPAPFTLTVVPSQSSTQERRIEVRSEAEKDAHEAKLFPRALYVVLTNTSKDAQPVFYTSNSWGSANVSFEITTAAGKKLSATIRPQEFTVNFPGTFLVPDGEQKVYAIRLDEQWEVKPQLLDFGLQDVTVKAIYEVKETKESKEKKVWTGRVESKAYTFKLYRYNPNAKG